MIIRNVITEDNIEYSKLIMEIIDHFGKEKNNMKNKLMQVVIIKFYILNSEQIPTEIKNILMEIISKLICEENSNTGKDDTFDYGMYGDCLFKTYGLVINTDIERFLLYSDPLYSMIISNKSNNKEFPKKVISYSLFIDFMVKFPYNVILYKFLELRRSSSQSSTLRVDKVLEMLVNDLINEPNIYLRCLIVKGMIKILLYAPELFKGLEIDKSEVIALLILQWHNQNLRHSSSFSLATLQTLSFYFVSQAGQSSHKLNGIGMSFLLLIETFFMIVRNNEAFNSKIVNLPFNTQDFMESLFKTFISLSSTTQNISISKSNSSSIVVNFK
jgi:hypothetical protein